MKLHAIAIILSPLIANATVAIDYTTVGAPGNAADANGNGAVSTTFQMGRYEVTNAQYVQFLNSADPLGANSLALYNASMTSNAMGGINFTGGAASGSKFALKLGYDNYPVVFVNIYDTFRFTNWLHNGQASGTTESGAYTLLGGTPIPSNAGSILRSPGAQVWIPNRTNGSRPLTTTQP